MNLCLIALSFLYFSLYFKPMIDPRQAATKTIVSNNSTFQRRIAIVLCYIF